MREGAVTKEAFIREQIKDQYLRGYVWCKAIKRSIYGDKRFDPSIRVGEDYEMMTELSLRAETFVYLARPLYYYIRRPASLTKTASLADKYRYHELAVERYRKHSALYDGLSVRRIVIGANNLVRRMYMEGDEEKVRRMEQIVKDNIGLIFTSKEYSFKVKRRAVVVWLRIAKWYYRWRG